MPDLKHKQMKISGLSKASGVSISTIKYYISEGLLPRPEKSKPNVAFYDDSYLKRLMVIKQMRSEGLSIKSVKAILDKYPFKGISEWERFKKNAREKDTGKLGKEEQLATVSDEERRTREILDAAYVVFTSNGYYNATVDDIAREAGVSKGTCYQYFSSKEEIFTAVLKSTVDRLIKDATDAAGEQKDPLARLGLKGMAFVSSFREVQSMLYGMYSEILGGNKELKQNGEEMLDRVAAFLSEDIRDGIDKKDFRPLDPMAVSYALIGIAELTGNLYLMKDEFDVPQFFLNLMEFIRHGLAV
ncbi:MAG: TetR family transcriptional regulator [Actinobacteria bacterium]|nr:TetR family transcriptional regulator [Actinomycetota bacterium]